MHTQDTHIRRLRSRTSPACTPGDLPRPLDHYRAVLVVQSLGPTRDAVTLPVCIVGSLPRVQQDAECPRDSGIENRAFDDLERVLWRRVLQREPLLEAAEVILVYRPRRHEVSAQYCTQSKEGRVLPTRTCALLYSRC